METKQTLRAKYPRQFTIMLSDELAARVERDAAQLELSRGEVIRSYLEAGIAAIDAED